MKNLNKDINLSETGNIEDELLTPKQVAKLLKCSKGTIYRLINKDKLPRPIKISGKLVRWPESLIKKWIEEEIKTITKKTF